MNSFSIFAHRKGSNDAAAHTCIDKGINFGSSQGKIYN